MESTRTGVPTTAPAAGAVAGAGRELTRRLTAAGALLGIDLVDHIALGDVRYCSFKEMGQL